MEPEYTVTSVIYKQDAPPEQNRTFNSSGNHYHLQVICITLYGSKARCSFSWSSSLFNLLVFLHYSLRWLLWSPNTRSHLLSINRMLRRSKIAPLTHLVMTITFR